MNLSIEYLLLFLICTSIYLLCKYLHNKWANKPNTIEYKYETLQTKTDLFNFKIDCQKLTQNNAVYLTNVKYDGKIALIIHAIHGIMNYFSDPINLFCLIISCGQIYEYSDFRSIIPLTLFLSASTLNYVYTMTLLINQQSLINNKKIHKLIKKIGHLVDGQLLDVYIQEPKKQKNLKRGDIIRLTEKDEIPADILIINSSILVQEIELTGENIVISKVGLKINDQSINTSHIIINHHQNEGIVITEDIN